MAYTTINKSSDYFNTKLYTGNGGTQGITGVGFKPDLNWIKDRDGTPSHVLHDIIRGVTKRLMSNNTNAEDTGSQINSFDTDGFTVPNNNNNTNGSDYVSWNWLGSNTTASNSNGSITSTVSFNATSGFSVVKWTGSGANATIGHGLGSTPKVILVKNATATGNWKMWHKSFATMSGGNATSSLNLNTTSALINTASVFNSMATINTNVFSVGAEGDTNQSNQTMVAYCFAEKQGYSKFGNYIGNGNADGTFIYTGFKPAFVMVKNASASQNWYMLDNKRDISNVCDSYVTADNTTAEQTYTLADFLSNGFKLRDTGGASNASGNNYIYMAFGQSIVGSNNTPATAR
tara:strand:+ start:90 stop:1130 length:1041 start_codon:yes stop_codon:yes gene_type:complete